VIYALRIPTKDAAEIYNILPICYSTKSKLPSFEEQSWGTSGC
jgi:hypothetical protein